MSDFEGVYQNCTNVGRLRTFQYFIDVSLAQRGFLKFEFWFSGLVNGWNLAHWNHRRRNPIFDHEKPFLTIKRALLTTLSHFSTTKCPQFVIFDCDRVILNDSNWFKPNPNLESENQNSPKSKLTRFSTHLVQFFDASYPFCGNLANLRN